jgi:N-acetylmuramoyl-L-alanine amidase CwlA
MKFKAPSPTFIRARHTGEHQASIKWIVLHSTVGPSKAGSARSVAHWWASGNSPTTSAHYVVDVSETIQCVLDHTVAYHCGYNYESIAVEICEYPSQTNQARWNDATHRQLMKNAARLVAELCLAYDIPPWFVGVNDLKKGKKGVTTHAKMSEAFHKSTHWDPGAWQQVRFMRMVRKEYKNIQKGK